MNPPQLDDKQRDFHQAYYLLQNQRQSQHETNRLSLSNFVLAGSLVALGFAAGKEGLPGGVLAIVLFAVVLANVLAILYARQSRYWVKVHQARASQVLSQLAPELVDIERDVRSISRRDMMARKSGNGSFLLDATRSQRLQGYLHLVLILGIAAFLVLVALHVV